MYKSKSYLYGIKAVHHQVHQVFFTDSKMTTEQILASDTLVHTRINDTHVLLYNRSEFYMEDEDPVEALVSEFK